MNDDHKSHAEGDRQDAETNRIAAEGNRMTAEDARVVTDKNRIVGETARAQHRRRLSLAQLGAYVLIVVVGLFAFRETSQQQHDLCRATVENRNAIRGVVTAVTDLGTGLVSTGKWEPDDELKVKQLREFKEQQFKTLTIPVCD